MNKPLWSILYMAAPCLALGGFALFLSRRAEVAAQAKAAVQAKANAAAQYKLNLILNPLKVTFVGVEKQPVTPLYLYQGYNQHFSLVFKGTGTHPQWWGQSNHSYSASTMKAWKFWLERKGTRIPVRPKRTMIWTSGWDATKKRYINEVFMRLSGLPTDAALKMKGTTSLVLAGGAYKGKPLPVEITLKRAGEVWSPIPIAASPSVAIQKIEILRSRNGQTPGVLTFTQAPGFAGGVVLSRFELLDKLGHPLRAALVPANAVSRTPSTASDLALAANTLQIWWSSNAIEKSKTRDIILKCRLEEKGSWPLEVGFPIKRDGHLLSGVVWPASSSTIMDSAPRRD